MCIVSRRTNIAYCIGNCPTYHDFCALKRRQYEEDPTAMDMELRRFEERGVIKLNPNEKKLTLTLILKEGEQKIKEVEIECVDPIQTLFLLSNLGEMTKHGCRQPCCELSCCVVNELTAVLQ